MKNEKALYIMEHIDSDLIDEADACKKTKKKNTWGKLGVAVACLCLVLVGTLAVRKQNPSDDETNNPSIADSGLCIPAMELPDTTLNAEVDMIGLVVYNGGIYTQAEDYYGAEAVKIDKLIGKYLGYATGSIDEWSTQEEYSRDFASNVAGKVYEVIGYGTDFRVCIRNEIEGENGEKQLWIQFLDRLNGITLATGADLFETRLHISDRIANIQWQSHNDWNYAGDNIQNATIETNLWEEFLDLVDKSPFLYTWNDDNTLSNPTSTNKSIYDTPKQAHIILTMKDGTIIRLRLIEGGYVGYDALGWYFVKIPGETFDAVFAACGGNE